MGSQVEHRLGKTTFKIHERARIVQVVVGRHTTDEDGRTCLSYELKSEGEIDTHVQLLKNDLDEAGRLAKEALRHACSKPMKLFD